MRHFGGVRAEDLEEIGDVLGQFLDATETEPFQRVPAAFLHVGDQMSHVVFILVGWEFDAATTRLYDERFEVLVFGQVVEESDEFFGAFRGHGVEFHRRV